MFIRAEMQHRLIPMWNSTRYINMSNVLRLEVEKNTVTFYTIFRPLKPATSITFESNAAAIKWADRLLPKQPHLKPKIRLDQPSADPLAIQAMADWDKERDKERDKEQEEHKLK